MFFLNTPLTQYIDIMYLIDIFIIVSIGPDAYNDQKKFRECEDEFLELLEGNNID